MGRIPNALLHFSVINEARKLREICKAPPTGQAFQANEADFEALPFKPTDLGFFIVLLPGQFATNDKNFTFVSLQGMEGQAHSFMSRHNIQALRPGLLMATTACTWDVVAAKYQLVIESLCYGAIAFTTPDRLQILAESPEHMR